MTRSLVCTVAALALLTGSAVAQNAAKPAGEGVQAPAAGGEGGERKLPPGGAAPKVPGATGGTASPGMKPNRAAEPQAGQKQQGENVGVEPKKAGEAQPGAPEPKPGAQGQPPAGQKAGSNQPAPGQAKPAAEAAKPAAGARPAPKLTSEQTTRVQTVFRDVHVQPVHVDFDVNVGIAVPRTVVLEPVPPTIISIVPAYEGFRFFVVPGEIVIVDPVTFEIVDVLPL